MALGGELSRGGKGPDNVRGREPDNQDPRASDSKPKNQVPNFHHSYCFWYSSKSPFYQGSAGLGALLGAYLPITVESSKDPMEVQPEMAPAPPHLSVPSAGFLPLSPLTHPPWLT